MNSIGQPNQHIPVFVGSTYEDLIDYRNAVRDALHRLETVVRGMEYFGSKPGSPKEECLKVVASCHLYIGIFAMRYGSLDETTGKSMTQLEYEEACRLKLPTLIYLIDEEKQPILPKYYDTGDKAKRLVELKTELKKKYTLSFFTTPDDLAKRVTQDLPPLLENIGVNISHTPPEQVSEDARTLSIQFQARPAKHAGKELLVDIEIEEGLEPVDADRCEALRLPLGDTIERDIKSDALENHAFIVASGEMADWLESAPIKTKFRVKIRLMFGKIYNKSYVEGEIVDDVRIFKAYRLIAVVAGNLTTK